MDWKVAALYRFVRLDDLESLRAELLALCRPRLICGTLLLAGEGVNGTIAGSDEALDTVLDALDRRLGISQGEVKLSRAAVQPFGRLKIRIRPEIVTMRAPEADPVRRPGTYVEPAGWNALIRDPDVVLLDTRNAYETRVGRFRGAVDPGLGSFTDFKRFVSERLDPARDRTVAMYCTGGIRCEKAAAFLRATGFETVFHLKGGILRYLEAVAPEESLWEGDCYVFDNRVALGHGLAPTGWRQCFGCGAPLAPADLSHPGHEAGVACRHCAERLTTARAAALRQRHARMTGEA